MFWMREGGGELGPKDRVRYSAGEIPVEGCGSWAVASCIGGAVDTICITVGNLACMFCLMSYVEAAPTKKMPCGIPDLQIFAWMGLATSRLVSRGWCTHDRPRPWPLRRDAALAHQHNILRSVIPRQPRPPCTEVLLRRGLQMCEG